MRVRLQVLVWRAADKTAPPEFTVNQPLSSFRWKMEEDILVPNHGCADIAPKSLLQLVACGYASQHHLVHDQVVVVGLVTPHTVSVKVVDSVVTTIPLPNRIHLWQKQMRRVRMMMKWLTNKCNSVSGNKV